MKQELRIFLQKRKHLDLDALPRLMLRHGRMLERAMRQRISSLLQLTTIKLLEHQRLITLLVAEIVPPVILVVLHLAELVPTLREDQSKGDDILRVGRLPITNSEGIPMNGLQRAPDIDDHDSTT